jgi:hypothetical protein
MHPTTSTTPTLTELAAAQKGSFVCAFNEGEEQRILARLRATYATKLAEREAFLRFFDECAPDIVLRAADGREMALRLPEMPRGDVYRDILEGMNAPLRNLEHQIISELRSQEAEAAYVASLPATPDPGYGLTILALCQATGAPKPEDGAGVELTQSYPTSSLPAAA